MKSNIPESIRAKLFTVSKEKKILFQDLLNRYGAEQFLSRLSASPYFSRFVFKGGSLLTYLIESDRKTKDLDFSIRQIKHNVADALKAVQKILDIELEDGLSWSSPEGSELLHPEMDYPGVRIKCPFTLGVAKGMVHMDLAIGDIVEARKLLLQKIQYQGKPMVGSNFDIMAYPPETIFAEKLQIAIKRGGQNTRMKDYYDLLKLMESNKLDQSLLRKSIENTFKKRTTEVLTTFTPTNDALKSLQTYWSAYLRKMKMNDAPKDLGDVIRAINQQLKTTFDDK